MLKFLLLYRRIEPAPPWNRTFSVSSRAMITEYAISPTRSIIKAVVKSSWQHLPECVLFSQASRTALFVKALHASNIFVNYDWNITSIINLEWACVRPTEMLAPPTWLSPWGLDEIACHLEDYKPLHHEFDDAFEREELD